MKSGIAAFLCFIVGFTMMWVGRAVVATSIPLMLFISFWLLMGFLFALHADTSENLKIIVNYLPPFRGMLNGNRVDDPQVVVAAHEEEVTKHD